MICSAFGEWRFVNLMCKVPKFPRAVNMSRCRQPPLCCLSIPLRLPLHVQLAEWSTTSSAGKVWWPITVFVKGFCSFASSRTPRAENPLQPCSSQRPKRSRRKWPHWLWNRQRTSHHQDNPLVAGLGVQLLWLAVCRQNKRAKIFTSQNVNEGLGAAHHTWFDDDDTCA